MPNCLVVRAASERKCAGLFGCHWLVKGALFAGWWGCVHYIGRVVVRVCIQLVVGKGRVCMR